MDTQAEPDYRLFFKDATVADNTRPTEAQVLAWVDAHAEHACELFAFHRFVGYLLIDALADAVANGAFSWRELFDDPAYAFAVGFDEWREDFRDELSEDDA